MKQYCFKKLNLKNLNLFFIFSVFFLFFTINNLQAEEATNIASNLSINNSLPNELIYPEYFKVHDSLLWENIRKELVFKLNFLTGKRPVKDYISCHKFQRRISRAVDRTASEGNLFFDVVDNKLLFGKDSGFEKILSPQPTLRFKKCNYHSIGNIKEGCVLYCDYHGMDFESYFYKQHKEELECSKPIIIAEDIAELILFLPFLLVLVIIYFLLPKNKNLPPSILVEDKKDCVSD